MRTVALAAFASLFMLFSSSLCLSQHSDPAPSFITDAKAAAKSTYDDLMRDQLGVFNGIEYVNYDKGISGDPFFPEDYYAKGTIEFNNMVYNDIPLKYDVVENKVLVEYFNHLGNRRGLVLENDKIDFFEFDGHHFVKIDANNPLGSLKEGFYDILLNEEIKIYASRKKTIDKKMKDGQMRIRFLTLDQYFVQLADDIHKVMGKSALLKLYGDHKKELKKYIKINRIDLRRNFEESLISVTSHYIKLQQLHEAL